MYNPTHYDRATMLRERIEILEREIAQKKQDIGGEVIQSKL